MISVLIPVYNVEQHIARCIESILNQTYQDFEIVIVNDGTPDNSMNIVEEFASKDRRIKVLHNPQNMGLMWTRRVGYQNAEGEYIVFCDSDDYLPENALEILYNSINEGNADIVVGNFEKANGSGPTGLLSNNQLLYGTKPNCVYKSLLKSEVSHSLWGKIFNAKLFKDKNYITHESFINAEDGMLLYQIVKNTDKIIAVKDSVYYYFENDESATQTRLSEKGIWSIVTFWNLIDDIFKEDDDLYKYAQIRNINAFVSLIRGRYPINEIFKHLRIDNFKHSLKIKSLFNLFSVNEAVKYYILIKYYMFTN